MRFSERWVSRCRWFSAACCLENSRFPVLMLPNPKFGHFAWFCSQFASTQHQWDLFSSPSPNRWAQLVHIANPASRNHWDSLPICSKVSRDFSHLKSWPQSKVHIWKSWFWEAVATAEIVWTTAYIPSGTHIPYSNILSPLFGRQRRRNICRRSTTSDMPYQVAQILFFLMDVYLEFWSKCSFIGRIDKNRW